ncbi:MAG: hypothetical protein IT340_23350, partial [Chloroflexi bacterium]|nr:hypothetical protein [Chloroflexota bacterium]
VAEAGATAPLVALAETLGAAVYTDPVTTHGRLSMPSDHALACGALPLFAPEMRATLAQHDVLLAVGADVISQYFHRDVRPLPEHLRLLHLDLNVREIGKNESPTVALIGDPHAGLEEITAAIAAGQSPAQRNAASARAAELSVANDARRAAACAEAAAERARQPLTALGLMHAIAGVLPDNAVIVDEAVTSSRLDFERFGWLRDPLAYYGHRGWGLGWGVGVALGAAIALPGRPVVGLLGEGSLLYGAQGLWTAAREGLPVVYIVCNNAGYAILKAGMVAAKLPSALAGDFLGMDLTGPEIDVPGLARAFGMTAHRVETADAVADAVAGAIRSGRPTLLDVPIDRGLGADRR